MRYSLRSIASTHERTWQRHVGSSSIQEGPFGPGPEALIARIADPDCSSGPLTGRYLTYFAAMAFGLVVSASTSLSLSLFLSVSLSLMIF